jgi:hypothetical protein
MKSMSAEPTNENLAMDTQRSKGNLDAMYPTGNARIKKTICLPTIEKDEPLVSKERIDEADRTITKPKLVNDAALTKSR